MGPTKTSKSKKRKLYDWEIKDIQASYFEGDVTENESGGKIVIKPSIGVLARRYGVNKPQIKKALGVIKKGTNYVTV